MQTALHISHALQLFNKGTEKGEVICHLLKSLLALVPESSLREAIVIYLEKHRSDESRVFLHQLSIAPPNNIHLNALLINEKKVDLISYVPSATISAPITEDHTSPNNKRPSKKWSLFHSKQQSSSLPSPMSPTSALHRVYDAPSNVIEKLQSFYQYPLPNPKEGLLILGPKSFFQNETISCENVAHTLSVLGTLYKKRHKANSHYVKERVFNEIVHTLDLPLIVFDVTAEKDEYHFRCTYYNESFKHMVQQKGTIGLDSLLLESSPQDQRYESDQQSIFFKFLHHPDIWQAIKNVLHKRPLKITRSSSGSFSNDIKEKESETIEVKYEDDLFPESHYEFHIYRVNGTRIGIVIRDVSERVRNFALFRPRRGYNYA